MCWEPDYERWKAMKNRTPQGASELKAMLCGTVATGPDCVVVECRECGWKREKLSGKEAVVAISEHMITHNVEFNGGAPIYGAASAGTKGYASEDEK